MGTKHKASDSERINKMIKIVDESSKESRGHTRSSLVLSDWEKIKNKDVSGLEEQFNTLFYMLFTRRIIPKPVTCIIEVTEGVSGLGNKKETLEVYFYLDPDKIATYSPYMISKQVQGKGDKV